MNRIAYKKRYLELIRRFLNSEISGAEFTGAYSKTCRQDRDETYAQAGSWPERFDFQLKTALERGEISGEDFSCKWAELWGYADDVPFTQMKDKVFTACVSFVPDPDIRDQPYEYDEEQLRAYVKETLAAYEAQNS